MDDPKVAGELDSIIPGVMAAYDALRADNGMGIYTSNGAFFNHTLFGRDASATGKFVSALDHAAARETILALAALQGRSSDNKTHEEPGRIHHELRDFSTWHGSWLESQILHFFSRKWGSKDGQLLTYFANDSTASYIRLVNKYANQIDRSILDAAVINKDGDRVTVGQSVASAADWILSHIDEKQLFIQRRRNKWALPFQTYFDSVTAYARADSSLAKFRQPMSYVETHMYAADALEDASKMLSGNDNRPAWQHAAHTLRDTFIKDFWNEKDNYFAAAIDADGVLDTRMVTAGWTLNVSLWDEVPADIRQERIKGIINMLFSDEFLTDVGLRSCSIAQPSPIPGVLCYHDHRTVWPMFTFMVVEGLHRHGFYKLARQLENRLVNGINADGNFSEFFVVEKDGTILRPVRSEQKAEKNINTQMAPEAGIAFTVVPSMVLAHRASYGYSPGTPPDDWRKDFEEELLSRIKTVERAEPAEAAQTVGPVVPSKFRRWRGNARTMLYFWRETRKR